MLRINVMEDETFRKDIINMAKALLKGVAEGIIREVINEEKWLEDRVKRYFADHPVESVILKELRSTDYWSSLGTKLHQLIDERIDAKMNRAIEQIKAKAAQTLNDNIQKAVGDELKRRLMS